MVAPHIVILILDASVVNAYILYRQLDNEITLKTFKGKCAEGFVETLIGKNALIVSKSPFILQINKSLEIRRKDSKYQLERSTRSRCALCSRKKNEVRTSWCCSVCKMSVCLGKKMCYNKYRS